MDARITQWINSFAGLNAVVDGVMIWITQFGMFFIVGFVFLQWWSRNDRLHVRHAAICAGLSFMLGLAVNQAILLVIHRLRPYDAGVSHLLVARSADWSFPSDHATASVSVAVSFLISKLPRRAIALFVMACLVSLSRIYVGMHYLTDILGGAATGIFAAVTIHFVYPENSRLNRLATRIF